jgi:hypothetical protein
MNQGSAMADDAMKNALHAAKAAGIGDHSVATPSEEQTVKNAPSWVEPSHENQPVQNPTAPNTASNDQSATVHAPDDWLKPVPEGAVYARTPDPYERFYPQRRHLNRDKPYDGKADSNNLIQTPHTIAHSEPIPDSKLHDTQFDIPTHIPKIVSHMVNPKNKWTRC